MRDYDDEGTASEAAASLDREVRRTRQDGGVKRAPGLDDRLSRLERAIDSLGSQVERAEQVLAPVLGHERPSPAMGQVRDEEESALARALDSFTGRIEHLRLTLDGILDRVDL